MSNQYKRFTIICQDWIKIDPIVLQEIKNYLEKHFESYTPSEKRVSDYYLGLSATCMVVYPTDSFVAKKLGVSRETVQRVKRKLVADGVMAKNYRHKRSCLYKISSYFRDFSVRKRLWNIFPALKIMPLIFILSSVQKTTANLLKSPQYEYATHINYQSNFKSLNVINTNAPISIGGILLQIGLTTEKKRINPGNRMKDDRTTTPEERLSEVNKEDRSLIEPEVLKITEIPLTRWGQIRLCAFEGPTIIHARRTFDRSLNGNASYISLFREALLYCRKNNIEPNFRRIELLGNKFNMPDNPRLVFIKTPCKSDTNTNIIPHKRTTEASKRKSSPQRSAKPEYIPQDISLFDEEEVYDRFEHAKKTNKQLAANLKKLGLDDWNPVNDSRLKSKACNSSFRAAGEQHTAFKSDGLR